MASKGAIRTYRRLYAKLLRLYPMAFYERFGEGMEQTFHDRLREGEHSDAELSASALWMFSETSAAIFKENLRPMMKKHKNILFIALGTALLLAVPAIAMQFNTGVNWSTSDFVVAGSLLFGSGVTIEVLARRTRNFAYRVAVGIAVTTALLLTWVNLAVGIIGSERNPVNLMYFGVVLVGIVGAIIARLQADRMARALFATAAAQMLVPLVALFVARAAMTNEQPGMLGVLMLNAFFCGMFISSGLLFKRASASSTS